jgi:hypothetical protein
MQHYIEKMPYDTAKFRLIVLTQHKGQIKHLRSQTLIYKIALGWKKKFQI